MYEKSEERRNADEFSNNNSMIHTSVKTSLRRRVSESGPGNIQNKIHQTINKCISQPTILPVTSSGSSKDIRINFKPSTSAKNQMDPSLEDICDKISCTMSNHYILSDLTQKLNSIFGPLILLSMGLYLLMITSLLYGTITCLSNDAFFTDLMFFLSSVNYIVRVLVLLPTYSEVNKAANEIVVTFARITTWAPESLINRMSLYLQHVGNEPIGISAWGFFTITLGTMLTFGGSVITYLVILFKND